MENSTPTWLKLLKLTAVIATIAAIVYGIQYLETMREDSASASRVNAEAALEAGKEQSGTSP
jgi:hypothetical protein